jgi:hypothetical protein
VTARFVGALERKKPLGSSRRRRENNAKIYPEEIRLKDVD